VKTGLLRGFACFDRKTKKLRLITTKTQDPDPLRSTKEQCQDTYSKARFPYRENVIFVTTLFLALSIPLLGYAGVLSFVQGLFVSGAEAKEVEYHNSQNIPLLSASISLDPEKDTGGPEIIFDEGEVAIMAEMGMFAPIAGEYISATGKEESVYVVRPGDTISNIAELFKVSSDTIRWRNDIGSKEYLRAGQEILVPPQNGLYHKVAKGDTVASLSKKYGTDSDSIVSWNSAEGDLPLEIGKEIFIPNGKPAVVIAPAKTPAKNTSSTKQSSSVKVVQDVPSQISKDALGEWVWPVNGGIVTQGYGNTSFASRSGYYKADFHGGVDIGAARGTEVLAAKAGTVTLSKTGYNGGYGNYIIITHDDGTSTRYGHNTKNMVKVGQRVVAGQVIGTVGTTGRVTGPHVHFEIRDADGKHLEGNVFYKTYKNY